MGFLLYFIALLALYLKPAIYVESAALPNLKDIKYVVKDAGDPVGVPCTKNVSNAWLDIVVAIDVSTNMGPSQVRQITLQLASELRKYPIGQSGDRYTRVALITYASTATIVGNLSTYSTSDQLYSAITGITGSTTDSNADMSDAVIQAYNILFNEQPCDQAIGCSTLGRPAAFVLFAATASGNTNGVLANGQNIQAFSTIVTVNYKPSDATLTSLLNQLASPSFNFGKTWSTSDLDWALTQSNCLCPWWSGTQLLVMEPSTGRYNRYAECFSIWELLMGPTNLTDIGICGDSTTGYPAALNAKATSDFIKQVIHDEIPNAFYIGLHRQNLVPSGPWKWYTFNGMDMDTTSFTDWAPDADPNSSLMCVLEKRLPGSTLANETIAWEPASCALFDTGVTNVICSLKACTTDYLCPTTFSFLEDRVNPVSMPKILNPKNMPKSNLKVKKHI